MTEPSTGRTLYRHVGDGEIDPAAWPAAEMYAVSDSAPLYFFAGDTEPGDAKGASDEWVVVPADEAAAAPQPAVPESSAPTAPVVPAPASDAPASGSGSEPLPHGSVPPQPAPADVTEPVGPAPDVPNGPVPDGSTLGESPEVTTVEAPHTAEPDSNELGPMPVPEPEPEDTRSTEEKFKDALARWLDAHSHDHLEQAVRELAAEWLGI